MEEKLENDCAILRQHLLEVVDLFVSLRPHSFRNNLMHSNHEDVLVVRAIEDSHHAFLRHYLVQTPQVIVCQLHRSGNLERIDSNTGWVARADHGANYSILP